MYTDSTTFKIGKCTFANVCTYVHLYVCTLVSMYTRMCAHLYVCTLVCVYTCMCVHLYVCALVCVYTCVYVHLCTSVYKCVHLYKLVAFTLVL